MHLTDKLKKWLIFFGLIAGNLLQIFIIVLFIDFLQQEFAEWQVNLYVLTNCNYEVFAKMFKLLVVSIIIVMVIALGRYLWFKMRYLKRISSEIKDVNKHNEEN
ncbi:hypothetical protein ACWCL1_01930 [Ligilactobacillus sp. LYQ135]